MVDAFVVTLDATKLEALSAKLNRLLNVTDSAARRSVNEVAARTYAKALPRMIDGINLTEGYARARLNLVAATSSGPIEARIASPRGRADNTALSHYRPQVVTQSAKGPRLKGDPARQIPAGQRSAGVSVEVSRGSRKVIKANNVFTDPSRRDSAGNPFIFMRLGGASRTGKDRLRRLMGPSVYQLFRVAASGLINEVESDLTETISASVFAEYLKVLE